MTPPEPKSQDSLRCSMDEFSTQFIFCFSPSHVLVYLDIALKDARQRKK